MVVEILKSCLFTVCRERLSAGLRCFVVFALLGGLMGASCGGERRPKVLADSKFDGWLCYRHQNVRIFYAPGHPQEAGFPDIAAGYAKALAAVCRTLDMPVPTDTIDVIFYTGWGQGQEMTGKEYPFVEDDVIHFWVPSYLGVTFMHWLLPRWVPDQPRHQFLRHGLITHFDHSGHDYHLTTLKFVKAGVFIPLAELAVDTSIDSNTERRQSSEAASFVSFVLGHYGPDVLKGLYQSQVPFDTLTSQALGVTVDSLEQLWLTFADLNVPPERKKELDDIETQ